MIVLYRDGGSILVLGGETLQALYMGIGYGSRRPIPLPVADAVIISPNGVGAGPGFGFQSVQTASRVDPRSESWKRVMAAANRLIPGVSRSYSVISVQRLAYDSNAGKFSAKTAFGEKIFRVEVKEDQ